MWYRYLFCKRLDPDTVQIGTGSATLVMVVKVVLSLCSLEPVCVIRQPARRIRGGQLSLRRQPVAHPIRFVHEKKYEFYFK